MLRRSTACASLGLLVMSVAETEAVAVPLSTVNSTTTSATSSELPSTITSAATLPPWGTLPVPLNTCSYTTIYNSTISETLWDEPWCSLAAGTVQLHFWPTSDNKTYPATVYDHKLDYTFTSPSVYMIINTLHASNECGELGPAPTNAIFGFDLTDVSTLVPYTDATATYAQSTRQLYLSDLGIGCSSHFNISKIQTQTHYTKDTIHRCNPRLAVPIQIKRYGYPYWKHCSNVGYRFGLFDPPYAMSPIGGPLVSTTQPGESSGVPTVTATPTPSTSSEPSNSPPASPGGLTSSTPPGVPSATETAGNNVSSTPTVSTHDGNPQSTSTIGSGDNGDNTNSGDEDEAPPPSPPPASVTTVSKQIVSLGPSGVVIIDEDGSGSATTSTYGVPAYGATEQASGVAQASVVVYQSQTLTLGGPAATITGAVIVLPKNSASARSSGVARVMTAGAPRALTGGLFGLILGALATVCVT